MPENDETPPLPGLPDDVEAETRAYLERPGPRLADAVDELCARYPDHADLIRARCADSSIRLRPERIGAYRILDTLGQGGMGTVYLAEQEEPVRRRVALKVIKLGMDSQAVLRRFEVERQTLARMNHDAIARVFEAGTTNTGQPYFVMEYAPGTPFTVYCDRNQLTLPERIRLFQQVCSGVQHAHQKGVIHRDLKPANVLVTDEQGRAQPKIIDFGLARATDQMSVQATMFTELGQVVGTPEYMSPEQADPGNVDIDTRTDIYSLGVMLYEVLVGERPFHNLRTVGLLEMQRVIREEEPLRPSSRLSTITADSSQAAERRRTTVPALSRALRGDLDWVVLKAMEKSRDRRYGSATELAADLERYLEHEPLVAGPPSPGYRLRKLVQKYRGQFVAAALLIISLAVGGSISTYLAIDNKALADSEQEQRRQAETSLDRFNQLRNVVLLRKAEAAEATTYPAWPRTLAAIRAWLRDHGEPLIAAVPALEAALAEAELDDDDRTPQGEFLRTTLADLVRDIRAFDADVVTEVRRRERWAEQITTGTLSHPNARATWAAAREAIRRADGMTASRRYRTDPPFELMPQCGLVPIGMNPATGLWEFYHLRSACDPQDNETLHELAIPRHREDGWIDVTESTGIVFVLLPGGTFWMGSQTEDLDASRDETLNEVTLAPYFVARHELTQGQYVRLTGRANPSNYPPPIHPPGAPSAVDLSHPVEHLDWITARRTLTDHGLRLPTEAQWEYACRAGTHTPWWTGKERESLMADGIAANVADLAMRRAVETDFAYWRELDDGWPLHAPVDALRANPWGLHHVHGNVFEWCEDGHGTDPVPPRPGDGLRVRTGAFDRVNRGGSYQDTPDRARSAYRDADAAEFRNSNLGVRPARAVQLDDFTR